MSVALWFEEDEEERVPDSNHLQAIRVRGARKSSFDVSAKIAKDEEKLPPFFRIFREVMCTPEMVNRVSSSTRALIERRMLAQLDLEHQKAGGKWIKCRRDDNQNQIWFHNTTHSVVIDRSHEEKKKRKRTKSYNLFNSNEPSSLVPEEDMDVVENLLHISDHPTWNFDNKLADKYRQRAAQQNYEKLIPSEIDDFAFPEYFANFPLPQDNIKSVKFYVLVLDEVKTVKLPLQVKDENGELKPTWPAKIIEAVLKKAQFRNEVLEKDIEDLKEKGQWDENWDLDEYINDPSNYMLKVVGKEEYLRGNATRSIFEYSSVRECVLNKKGPRFEVICRSVMNKKRYDAQLRREARIERCAIAYPQYAQMTLAEIHDDQFKDPQITLELGITNFVDYAEPFRFKILEAHGAPTKKKNLQGINFTVEVWIGKQMICQTNTHIRTKTETPSQGWYETSMKWNEFPPDATVCVYMVGIARNANQNTILAWTRFPIMSESRRLISGEHNFQLWLTEDDAVHESQEYRFRGIPRPRECQNEEEACTVRIEFDDHQDVCFPHNPYNFYKKPEKKVAIEVVDCPNWYSSLEGVMKNHMKILLKEREESGKGFNEDFVAVLKNETLQEEADVRQFMKWYQYDKQKRQKQQTQKLVQVILPPDLRRGQNTQTSIMICRGEHGTSPKEVVLDIMGKKKLKEEFVEEDADDFLLHIPNTCWYFSGSDPVSEELFRFFEGKPFLGPVCLLKREHIKDDEEILNRLTEVASLNPLSRFDPFYTEDGKLIKQIPFNLPELTTEQRCFLFEFREELCKDSSYLPVFLTAIDWTDPQQVIEAHRMLQKWQQPEHPVDWLELLDCQFADEFIRSFAVDYLEYNMDDATLAEYLLELVQVLKYENHHHSILANWLIHRGLQNPYQVGNYLFWHLKAEYHVPRYCERFGLMMECYLKHVGAVAEELVVQQNLTDRLAQLATTISGMVKRKTAKESIKKFYRQRLKQLTADIPNGMRLPLMQTVTVRGLFEKQCRWMSSKKVPLWLEFQNDDIFDKEPKKIMFKSGDDLRQDMLTLQIFKVMEIDWLALDLDLGLKPYKVISCGDQIGYLELVTNSETVNSINSRFGGPWGENNIVDFFQEQARNKHEMQQFIEIFTRSSAGYLVATYTMGIGDRHPDNFMISRTGRFFHIDFGHFLGNFKSKLGWARERVPMVYFKSMNVVIRWSEEQKKITRMSGRKKSAAVAELSDKNFEKFLDYCVNAYDCLRKRNRFYCNLFRMMIPAEMPELLTENDILYLKNMLYLNLTSKGQVEQHLRNEIKKSLEEWYRYYDWFLHDQANK